VFAFRTAGDHAIGIMIFHRSSYISLHCGKQADILVVETNSVTAGPGAAGCMRDSERRILLADDSLPVKWRPRICSHAFRRAPGNMIG
jgi:hypothetical protein